MSRNKSYEINMTEGPILSKVLLFSLPLMASGILQLLFNAADMVVAGRFAGSLALGAVGCTSSLINLIINVLMGLSVGVNVCIAHFQGANCREDVQDTVHTSIPIALICAAIFMTIGIVFAKPLLSLTGAPAELINYSALYMRIYFLGLPVMGLYNFGASILRAVGDTRRPLIYLIIAGIVNVILNLIFVIVLNLGVAGVAMASSLSQAISAFLVLRCLIKSDTDIHLDLKLMHISRDKLKRICQVGLPAGLQGAIFSISNVLVQSSVNSFGSIAVAGNTASSNLEGFVYNAMNTFYQSAVSFTSQNLGAKKLDRIKRVMAVCLCCVFITGLSTGFLSYLFGRQLLSLYTTEAEVIEFGLLRMKVVMLSYFLCGMMDTFVGVIRGLGDSLRPMAVALLGCCALRILWVFTVFKLYHSLTVLYLIYPISWLVAILGHIICFTFIWRKLNRSIAS